MENKIIFLLVAILLLYLMFTKAGLQGLKRLIGDITGSNTATTTSNGVDNTNHQIDISPSMSGNGSQLPSGQAAVKYTTPIIRG